MRRLHLAGLALLGLAQAQGLSPAPTPADELVRALQRARSLEARGQVQVTVNFPPRPDPVRQAGKLPELPFRPGMLARNFKVIRAAPETVAGRPTDRFDLVPKNGQAARWSLWIDQRWNIPLAFEERRADGSLARQAIFARVNAQPVRLTARSLTVPEGLRGAVLSALPGLKLPPGFTPVSVRRAGQRLEIRLSDGANTLLLVSAPRNVQAAEGVASRKVGGRFVWLVGNLPQSALASALAGVRQIDEAGLGTFLATDDAQP